MSIAVVRKLRHGAPITENDELAIGAACCDIRNVPAHEDLISEGDAPDNVHVVLEGFACRYKLLPDGGRQIMAWLVPGDFCDLRVAILGEMDHSIGTLTASRIGLLPRRVVEQLVATSPTLARALWWATLVDEGILREWLVNMGRRPADKRIAHLFCELLARLQAVGLAVEDRIDMPLTQVELADTVGLSPVHVNRVLSRLREEKLIAWSGRSLVILDAAGLRAFAEFDGNYLHLKRQPAEPLPA
ncbi:MAG TPA: Crp/Fnr family transcriptional regulator [Phenylobacterium sp.]